MNKISLTFTVNQQELKNTTKNLRLASGTVDYVDATFELGDNWDSFDSVRAIWTKKADAYSTVLDAYGYCKVPTELLADKGTIKVNLVGSISETVDEEEVLTDRLTTFSTTALSVSQLVPLEGGETSPLTPSQFEQFVLIVQGYSEDAVEAKEGAETAQGLAETAQQAAETAQGLAEQAVTDAQGYASDASGYAEDASGYAENASGSADSASQSATASQGFASDAQSYSEQASGYATSAQGYSNDASGYADDASDYATQADEYADDAHDEAILARSYARGDTSTRTGETTDNAKYYAEQAEEFAEAFGEKIAAVEENIDYGIECIINGAYRKRTIGKELNWENGGMNSTTGTENTNAHSIRTGFLEFEEAKVAVQDTHQTYRIYLHAYNKETGAWIGQENKTDIRSEYQFTLNPAHKYRLQLYNTAQTVRAVADDFVIYDVEVQKPVFISELTDDIDYAGYSAQDGNYRKRWLGSRMVWNNGGLNGSGVPTGNQYSVYSDFVEFDSDTITAIDTAGKNYRIMMTAYNKSTGAFIEQTYKNGIGIQTNLEVNPNYKYRIVLYDMTDTARPTGQTLTIYKYSDTVEKRKSEVKATRKSDFAKRRPLVTIIDDDGSVEFYNRYFSNGTYLVNYPMCTAYEGESLGRADFMTKEQLKYLVDAGCEILGHGSTPLAPSWDDEDPITIEEAEEDVIANLKPLLDAGFEVGGYCYPYGSTNVEVREMIQKYYTHAYAGMRPVPEGTKWYNDGCIPTYAIARYPLYDGNNQLKSWVALQPVIEATVTANGWLVLYTHTWRDTEVTATAQALNTLFAQIEQAGAEIVTASEAYEVFKNAWQAGDYLGPWNKFEDWSETSEEYETHTLADAGSAVSQTGQTDLLLIE